MFDAGAYLRAQEPPIFKDPTGVEHLGRVIGTDTWLRLQAGLRVKNADGTVNPRGLDKAMHALVNAFFPHPWYKLGTKSVADWIWELPEDGRMRAIWDFMRSQARATGTPEPAPLPGTSLPNTPSPDAPAPDSPTPGSSASSTNDSPASTTSGVTAGA